MAPQRCKAKLEDVWRSRLYEAAGRHKAARANCAKLREEFTKAPNLTPGDLPAIRQATLDEDAARNEHLRILEIFTDLIVRHTAPPED